MKRMICVLLVCALALLGAGCGASVRVPDEADALLRQAEDALKDAKELLKSSGAEEMLDEVRSLMEHSGEYSDAELEQALRSIAAEKGLQLNDSILLQLVKLIRGVEKGISFKQRVETAKDKVDDAAKSVKDVFG